MDERQTDAVLAELRDRISDMLAAVQLLTPLVRDSGSRADKGYLAAVNKSLYRLVRLLRHADMCGPGEVSCRREPVDLAGLCRDMGRHCEDMAGQLGIAFDWTLGESGVLSLADDQLLEMALLNILTNAFQAAGRGGSVTLRAGLADGAWRVTVEDSGPGLTAREEEADPMLKQPGGVGLGLEAARRILALHDGSLMLDDGGKGGVRAVATIPIKKPSREDLLRTPETAWDAWGGFSPAKVEFSPLLPMEAFGAEDEE